MLHKQVVRSTILAHPLVPNLHIHQSIIHILSFVFLSEVLSVNHTTLEPILKTIVKYDDDAIPITFKEKPPTHYFYEKYFISLKCKSKKTLLAHTLTIEFHKIFE